jgi:PAS domain S-box-containing protein
MFDSQDLTVAFYDFNAIVERFQQTHDNLLSRVETLHEQLETKNRELEKRIEEEQNTRNFLNGILENIYTAVLVINQAGEIILFNKAAEDITGHRKEDILGASYQRIFDIPESRTKSALYTLATGKESHHRQKVLITRDNREKMVEFSTTVVLDGSDNILGVVEVFNDISELKKLQERITHIETLAALGEMAASVAHEIRNPLGGIGGFAGLLDRQLEPGDPRRRFLSPIIEGVSRLNRIVTDLLTYTRPQKMVPVEVCLQKTLRDIADFFRLSMKGTSEKPVEIEFHLPEEEVWIKLDPALFQQVIINLLRNAWDAVPEPGRIELRLISHAPLLMNDILDDEEKAELLRLFSTIDIEIADNGCGIPEDTLSKLFVPFFTTKENGNGLGLPICKKIAMLHKGDISVTSKVGEGTRFTITLPLHETYEEENPHR